MYQNHDLTMHNRKSTFSRALAFWLGLTLHLSLGAALYHQVINHPATQTRPTENSLQAVKAPAKPWCSRSDRHFLKTVTILVGNNKSRAAPTAKQWCRLFFAITKGYSGRHQPQELASFMAVIIHKWTPIISKGTFPRCLQPEAKPPQFRYPEKTFKKLFHPLGNWRTAELPLRSLLKQEIKN